MQDLGTSAPTSFLRQLSMQRHVFDQALQQYPALRDAGVVPTFSPGGSQREVMEFWPPGEPGSDLRRRPSDIPHHAPGVQIFSDEVRPIDILGDVVSHHLVKTDPKIKGYYDKFKDSLTDDQQSRLSEQYQHATEKLGETRPFSEWSETSGIPAYFRGYPFQQWPAEFNQQAYTPQQRELLDDMMKHLSGNKQ